MWYYEFMSVIVLQIMVLYINLSYITQQISDRTQNREPRISLIALYYAKAERGVEGTTMA